MDSAQILYNQKVGEKVVKAIKRRNMKAVYVENRELARKAVLDNVFSGAMVYRCGSCTLTEIGVWDEMAKLDEVEIVDPFEEGIEKAESFERRMKGLTADIMISSS